MRLKVADPAPLAAVGFLIVGLGLSLVLLLGGPFDHWNPLASWLGSFHSAQTADYDRPDYRPVAPQRKVETAGVTVRMQAPDAPSTSTQPARP
jgi:hypothetical protein